MKVHYALQVKNWCKQLYGTANLSHLERIDSVIKSYKHTFGDNSGCYLASSSGRVEIIGNHTDHNGGKVIACTVDKDILAGFDKRDDGKVIVKSAGFKDIVFHIDHIDHKEQTSCGMIKGVLQGLVNNGHKIGGFCAVLDSTVPRGAGMSSSASFQLLIGTIQSYLYNDNNIDNVTLAEIGQFSENTYFNKPCGLMDQATIAVGGIVSMDFGGQFSYNQVAESLPGLSLIVVNTGGSHAKLTDEYASIPTEMYNVAKMLGGNRLCQVDKEHFYNNMQNIKSTLGIRPMLRAKHYYDEVDRVLETAHAIHEDNTDKVMELIANSGHSSMYQLQNVTFAGGGDEMMSALQHCQQLLGEHGVVRVHGGGFAGTILLVVSNEYVHNIMPILTSHYGADNVYNVKIRSVGATVLTVE